MLWAFALGSTEHVLMLLDERGRVTWANPGAGKILGIDASALPGENVARFFIPTDVALGIPKHERDVARESGTASDDRWMLRADGSRFWAAGVTRCLGTGDERHAFLKVFRDLTEFKMQLESLRERSSAAAQEREQVNVAVAVLAHELRNPLSAIGLGASVMERRSAAGEDLAMPAGIINRNVSLAARLIDDLMEHSKVSSDGFSLERGECTLRELLDASASIALRQLGQSEREVAVLVPAGDPRMYVDCMRMQQVFVNLIANAARYTPPPGRVWVTGSYEGSEVIVRVSDEGVGIEPERLERLFDLFTLPHLKGSKLGLGLGLSLVKKIVDLHGGSVQARSDGRGHGSAFTVRFPAALP